MTIRRKPANATTISSPKLHSSRNPWMNASGISTRPITCSAAPKRWRMLSETDYRRGAEVAEGRRGRQDQWERRRPPPWFSPFSAILCDLCASAVILCLSGQEPAVLHRADHRLAHVGGRLGDGDSRLRERGLLLGRGALA